MNWRKLLPETKWLIVILFISSLNPLYYVILGYFSPEGYIFNGSGEDGTRLSLMKSVEWEFQSPWMTENEGTVFHNPSSSPFVFVFLGLISYFLNINYFIIFVLAKFIFTFTYLIVTFYIIRELTDKRTRSIAYFIFVFTSGMGGILYLTLLNFSNPVLSSSAYALFYDIIGSGINIWTLANITYYTLPLTIGYLAVLFFIKSKSNKSYLIPGILFGVSYIFYPIHAVGFALIMGIYAFVKSEYLKFIKTILVSVPFSIPYILAYLQKPFFFNLSAQSPLYGSATIYSNILALGIPLVFVVYFFNSKLSKLCKNKRGVFILFWAVSILLFSTTQFSESISFSQNMALKDYLGADLILITQFFNQYSIIFKLPLLVLFLKLVIETFRKSKKDTTLFVSLWFLIFFVFSVFPSEYARLFPLWFPFRLLHFIMLPMSIIVSKGILEFSQRYRINYSKVLTVLFVFSLPSLLVLAMINLNVFFKLQPVNLYDKYYSVEDVEAMKYLKTQEPGTVLSSFEIGSFLPFYSDKKTLIGGHIMMYSYPESKASDQKIFYSAETDVGEKLSIMEKYDIKYVYFGYNEKKISNGKFNPDKLTYLEKIYENEKVEIYKRS